MSHSDGDGLFAKQKDRRRRSEDIILVALKATEVLSFTELHHATVLARPTQTKRLSDMKENGFIAQALREKGRRSRLVYRLTSDGIERAAATSLPQTAVGDADDLMFRSLHVEIVALTRRVVRYFGGGKARYSTEDPARQLWIGAFVAGGSRLLSVRFIEKEDRDFFNFLVEYRKEHPLGD